MLVLDETGFVKKGAKSVGVQRQYTGTAGRVENCQVGVFLGYASRHGHALLDRALYLPEGWAGDPGRRAGAGVPARGHFRHQAEAGAADAGAGAGRGRAGAWVAGDEVYGGDRALRRRSRRAARGYVLARDQRPAAGREARGRWAAGVPARAGTG